MQAYTQAMQDILDKQITSFADMVNRTIKKSKRFSDSFGNVMLAMQFEDEHWVVIEPKYFENDGVDFEILETGDMCGYNLSILKRVGFVSKEIYEAENDMIMQHYHASQDELRRNNIIEWIKDYPDLLERIRNGELP